MHTTPNTSKPQQHKAARKFEVFVGITKREYERLKSIQPAAFKMYVGLRWMANFRTGRIGDDPQHPVNDNVLCDSLGQSAEAIAVALTELAQSGLIVDFRNVKGAITMSLPLAADNSAQAESSSSQIQIQPPVGNPSKTGSVSLTSSNFHDTKYCDTSTNQNLYNLSDSTVQHPITTPTSFTPTQPFPNSERVQCSEQGQEHSPNLNGKQDTLDDRTLASTQDFKDFIDELDDWDFENFNFPAVKKQTLEEKLQNDQHLTVQELKDYLSSLNFLYVSGAMSERLYPRIVQTYTALEIKHAAQSVCSDPKITPAPLRLSEALAKSKKTKGSGRGRVAL